MPANATAEPDMSSVEVSCDDDLDDDGDGATDCADEDCAGDPACADVTEICDNNLDDDGDGDIDCADKSCSSTAACLTEDCIAPGDEDGDGLYNCADDDCTRQACSSKPGAICSSNTPLHCVGGEDRDSQCDDGLDNDFDDLVDCMDPDCAGSCACGANCSELCNDTIDNDGDGVVNEGCACQYLGLADGVCAMARIDLMGVCARPMNYREVDICGDTLDNDCNGIANDGCACDFNGITEGVCGDGVISSVNGQCEPPSTYQANESSCDDFLDNDCDGAIDGSDGSCM